MTAEYLDKGTLVARLEYYLTHTQKESGEYYAYSVALQEVRNATVTNVAPVVHGRWLKEEKETYCPVQYGEDGEPILHKYTCYTCSLCGRNSGTLEPYCHCGAKMNGGEE